MRIRPRIDADLQDCAELARIVHEIDGYPPYLPGGDIESFIRADGAMVAWVAERDEQLVGHVVLNPASSAPVMALAAKATGRSAEGLAVVARLLVSPLARRTGVGTALLSTAAAAAFASGRWPVLDVATRFSGAVALYEASGWERVGVVGVTLPDGAVLEEYVFIAATTAPNKRSAPATTSHGRPRSASPCGSRCT